MQNIDICHELTESFADTAAPISVDLARYTSLYREGKGLIRNWFQRGWEARFNFEDVPDIRKPVQSRFHGDYEVQRHYRKALEQSFDAFSHVWYAFNHWSACVTDEDRDRRYISALLRNDILYQDFARITSDPNAPAGFYARWFAELWPIFDVKSLLRAQIRRSVARERSEVIKSYLNQGAHRFEPPCWERHQNAGEQVPVDWPHTLVALYKVRCNLFHGQKMPNSENDQLVVFTAFHTLVYFLQAADYFELHAEII